MVKGLIDNVTGDNNILVSVASDTENKTKKTCQLLADEENRFVCVTHVFHLVFYDFCRSFPVLKAQPLLVP